MDAKLGEQLKAGIHDQGTSVDPQARPGSVAQRSRLGEVWLDREGARIARYGHLDRQAIFADGAGGAGLGGTGDTRWSLITPLFLV